MTYGNKFDKLNKEEVELLFDCLHGYDYGESEWKERKINESLRQELIKRLTQINKEEYSR